MQLEKIQKWFVVLMYFLMFNKTCHFLIPTNTFFHENVLFCLVNFYSLTVNQKVIYQILLTMGIDRI